MFILLHRAFVCRPTFLRPFCINGTCQYTPFRFTPSYFPFNALCLSALYYVNSYLLHYVFLIYTHSSRTQIGLKQGLGAVCFKACSIGLKMDVTAVCLKPLRMFSCGKSRQRDECGQIMKSVTLALDLQDGTLVAIGISRCLSIIRH
jgi:hypothetical protein